MGRLDVRAMSRSRAAPSSPVSMLKHKLAEERRSEKGREAALADVTRRRNKEAYKGVRERFLMLQANMEAEAELAAALAAADAAAEAAARIAAGDDSVDFLRMSQVRSHLSHPIWFHELMRVNARFVGPCFFFFFVSFLFCLFDPF